MSTDALARNKKVRAGHRSSATRLMNQVDEASAVTGGPAIDKLLQWKLSLNEKLTKLQSLDDEILTLVDDGAIEEEIEQADVFRERLQQLICGVERLISLKLNPTVTHASKPPSSPSVADSSSKTSETLPTDSRSATSEEPTKPLTGLPLDSKPPSDKDSGTKVKLPKLTLKTFNGDLTKWETFWSVFESSIHSNSSLSAVDKFTYLNSLLDGPALRAIDGLQLTASN